MNSEEIYGCDIRGIKRGRCQAKNCDCERFQFDLEKGSACSYCECPPPKHVKIVCTNPTETVDTSSESLISGNQHKGIINVNGQFDVLNVECNNPIPVDISPSTVCEPSVTSTSENIDDDDLLPENLPKAVQQALDAKKLTRELRNCLVRSVAEHCISKNFTKATVKAVAEKAVEKWSLLKAPQGKESGLFFNQLKKRLVKLNRPAEHVWQTNEDENDDKVVHSDAMTFLIGDFVFSLPSVEKLRNHSTVEREKRNADSKTMSAAVHLSNTPALKLKELHDDLLPENLPTAVQQALDTKKLTRELRNCLVRSVAEHCVSKNFKKATIKAVAKKAVEKWSLLKAPQGKESALFFSQLKKRVLRLRMPVKHVLQTSQNETDAMTFMMKELKSSQPSVEKLKIYLTTLRKKRSADSKTMPAAVHLTNYPALKRKELLLWEFCSIVGVPEEVMNNRWKLCISQLLKYVDNTPYAPTTLSASDDAIAIHFLITLPKMLGRETKNNTRYILQIFEENTLTSTTVPPASDPPRLIAIGDVKKADLTFTCYLDSTPLFTSPSVSESVILLLASYWVFSVRFPADAKSSFQFLTLALLHKEAPKMRVLSPAASGLIKQLNLGV